MNDGTDTVGEITTNHAYWSTVDSPWLVKIFFCILLYIHILLFDSKMVSHTHMRTQSNNMVHHREYE